MPIITAHPDQTISFPTFDELWSKYSFVDSIKFYDVDGEGVTEIDAYDANGEYIDLERFECEDDVWEAQQDLFNLCGDACPGYYAVKGVVTQNSDGTYTFTNHNGSTYTSPSPKA